MNEGTLSVPGARICYKVRGAGPVLLAIQGGGGTADATDGIADVLESEFTIVSYDRRGLLRSPLTDRKQPLTIERHADDALALLDAVGAAQAFVFGSSLGALIGLALVLRAPGRVTLLVAHEPPTPELLSDERRAEFDGVRRSALEIALREGPRAAFRHVLAAMGIDRDDRESEIEPPASCRAQSRDTGFLLSQEVRAIDAYRLDFAALERAASRIVPAYGASSHAFYPAECARALAHKVGRRPVEFPGGHNGYVLRPRAFAETLRAALDGESSRGSRAEGVVLPA
ncbi:MAG TPA: alpha/beta hydrolase [Polyangiaceae bacterium]|nr:alpha/beta hydrolase [Polyangiaceae bacterium]